MNIGDLLLDSIKSDAYTWFGFFKSFEDYVDFFRFNDFVEIIGIGRKKSICQ